MCILGSGLKVIQAVFFFLAVLMFKSTSLLVCLAQAFSLVSAGVLYSERDPGVQVSFKEVSN